jgi:cardiolipin hydrolase
MHNKFAIMDENILLTGSFNWTYSAVVKNFENILVTGDAVYLEKYIPEFERMWE